jgi:tetratricopeptide (TPR) repeat protein
MIKKMKTSGYSTHLRRRRIFRVIVPVSIILLFLVVAVPFLWRRRDKFVDARELRRELWNNRLYPQTFDMSREMLETEPLNYEALILRGFSAYQLSLAQITDSEKTEYIEIAENCLRNALLVKANTKMDGAIYYVLGKTYYTRGEEYADLAVQSLEASKQRGFKIEDMDEWLGLAYAGMRDYEKSVRAFEEAAQYHEPPPDALLLSIAKSYASMGDTGAAIAYFLRCVETSKDYKAAQTARFSLGEIYFQQENYAEAEKQYVSVLNDFGESAEAHYRLGEIYAANNNLIRARAEWRKAVQIDPAHKPSRSQLAMR